MHISTSYSLDETNQSGHHESFESHDLASIFFSFFKNDHIMMSYVIRLSYDCDFLTNAKIMICDID